MSTLSEPCEMIEHLPFTQADGFGTRARIGLVVLASDYTIEGEFRQIFAPLAPGVAFYQARIANDPIITPESLAAMGPRLADTAATLLPGFPLDVVAYGCTSASTVLGEDVVAGHVNSAKPGAKVTTPITAAFRAFKALGMQRVAVLTPYTRAVNEVVLNYLQSGGVEVPVFGSFNEPDDQVVARIDTDSLVAAIRQLIAGRAVDGVFVSCTSVRLVEAVAGIEAEIGLPVTSSNHALAWDCLRQAGIDDRLDGLGRLFQQ
ncbi:aspartate/glutamate racemase family protein [Rhodobacteraceae bacterium NNCM2]|nr:aspartate/glutamate racemase family protein [Coraliihabitans acroporae]